MLMNSVPKDCIKQTDKVTLVDVTGIPNHPYQKLVIYRNPSVGIYDIEEHLDADCSGCILIDAVVAMATTDTDLLNAMSRMERS